MSKSNIVTQTNEDKKSLLNLPPEIWSKICKLAVEHPSPIEVEHRVNPRRKLAFKKYEPLITIVCHTIRNEHLAHFYKANIFYCESICGYPHELKARLVAIGQTNVRAPSNVYFTKPISEPIKERSIDLWHATMRIREISEREFAWLKGERKRRWLKVHMQQVFRGELDLP